MQDHITTKYATHEKASARIHELEQRLGLPCSIVSEYITEAWDRLSILEELAAAKAASPAAAAPPARPAARPATPAIPHQAITTEVATGKPLYGVNRLARAFALTHRH